MSALIVNTNISAMFTSRQNDAHVKAINRSVERLASGSRINKAADDAAGLAISENMRTQINGLRQGTDNAQDGMSLLQVAEAGMSEIQGMLQRMRTLAVQAANDTLTDPDRNLIQTEINQILEEIDRQASSVNFNGRKLLDGTATAGTVTTFSTTSTPSV